MSAFIIEAFGDQVGLVIRERRGFRFFAADHRVRTLDGRLFKTTSAAMHAARGALTKKRA